MKFLKKIHRHHLLIKKCVNKTVLKTITLSVLLMSCNFSCSKEDNGSDNNNNDNGEIVETPGQITANDFETFEGEIGIALDARPLARKGYNPTQVTININATSGNYTQTVPIEEFSFMGQLKIPLDGLSEDAKQELINGVEITPEYKNNTGNVIFTEPTFTTSLQSNPSARIANTTALNETQENQALALGLNTKYYIQRLLNDGTLDSGAWRHLTGSVYDNVISANVTEFNGNEPDRMFQFVPVPGEFNTFAIRHAASSRFLQISIINQFPASSNVNQRAPNLSTVTSFSEVQSSSDYNNFKFKFEKQDHGGFLIKSYDDLPIQQAEGYGLTVQNSVNGTTSIDYTWRVVSTSVDWSINNIGTTFLDPILPPAETGFSFNSTLTNCGSGNLSQTVGVNVTETRTRTVGWEETITASTSNSIDVSTTVEVGFEAGFFGNTANYNMSLTAGYSHDWSSTNENSNWEEETDTEEETLFSERTVTVPSGSASLVYDVYQFYPETTVNFVQRMRVEGIDSETGSALTGEEIRTLFYVNKFNGVITSVEANSIVITLKGTVTLDKIIETESSVQDVPANCN